MNLHIRPVNFQLKTDCQALLLLLDAYAQDPMGGGSALSMEVKTRLCSDMAARPTVSSFIAWLGDDAVGLINCVEGFSTFKSRPLMNIHDLAVLPEYRNKGIGQALLQAAQAHAQRLGCCKLTLEVLTGNEGALRTYTQFGFEAYTLDPTIGHACFMHKWLES